MTQVESEAKNKLSFYLFSSVTTKFKSVLGILEKYYYIQYFYKKAPRNSEHFKIEKIFRRKIIIINII